MLHPAQSSIRSLYPHQQPTKRYKHICLIALSFIESIDLAIHDILSRILHLNKLDIGIPPGTSISNVKLSLPKPDNLTSEEFSAQLQPLHRLKAGAKLILCTFPLLRESYKRPSSWQEHKTSDEFGKDLEVMLPGLMDLIRAGYNLTLRVDLKFWMSLVGREDITVESVLEGLKQAIELELAQDDSESSCLESELASDAEDLEEGGNNDQDGDSLDVEDDLEGEDNLESEDEKYGYSR